LQQEVVDKLPEEDKETLQLKLGPSSAAVIGNNNAQLKAV
tara:strand:- start:338 stop:457 length:120 start_codon:yes stop_codon:yes gene_type:complete